MNFLNNTKLIFKSVLDLVPAVLLAIIVAIIAGYGMNSLNKNFKEINEVQLQITNKLEKAKLYLGEIKSAATNDVPLATKQNSLELLENANDTEDVFVGRVRCQAVGDESWVSMWIVADNVYGKGAALNAVQIIQNLIENSKLC